MGWNYRVLKSHDPDRDAPGDAYYLIIEAYYDDEGSINGWAAIGPGGTTLEELDADLEMMREALTRPVLVQRTPYELVEL